MNISHHHGVGNNSRVVPAHFVHSPKALASDASGNASNSRALPQKPHLQESTKSKAESKEARLANISHDHNNQSSSVLLTSKTITVLISFLKLSKYDDAWLKLGKQLLLLHKSPNKHKFYRAGLACFKSAIKAHPDNYVSYYFSGLTLCLLGRYAEAVRMFDLSLRKNTETSTALLHTLSEMLSVTEGIRLVTGNSDVNGIGNRDASMQQGSSSNNRYLSFSKNLDKLERVIINKLQRYKIDGVVGNI